jgi:hypothetical protein
MNSDSIELVENGVGLDIGTMNIVSARQQEDRVLFRKQRDAFFDLDITAKPMLRLNRVPFIQQDDRLIILGDSALAFANVFNRELRRPLSQGLISNTDREGAEILQILIQNTIGKPQGDQETCCFSVPGNPVDLPGRDNVYHRGVFSNILKGLGYKPIASNEALAVIFSETAPEMFSGVALSFGAGMVNISCAYQTQAVQALQFAVARSGDYIDQQSAQSLGLTAAKMCKIKEDGIDLRSPSTQEESALAFYYQEVIRYALGHIVDRYKMTAGQSISFPEAVPMILSGGTTLVKGFHELFSAEFERCRKKFPIPISEIRMATDPLNAVASGLLIQAQQED